MTSSSRVDARARDLVLEPTMGVGSLAAEPPEYLPFLMCRMQPHCRALWGVKGSVGGAAVTRLGCSPFIHLDAGWALAAGGSWLWSAGGTLHTLSPPATPHWVG